MGTERNIRAKDGRRKKITVYCDAEKIEAEQTVEKLGCSLRHLKEFVAFLWRPDPDPKGEQYDKYIDQLRAAIDEEKQAATLQASAEARLKEVGSTLVDGVPLAQLLAPELLVWPSPAPEEVFRVPSAIPLSSIVTDLQAKRDLIMRRFGARSIKRRVNVFVLFVLTLTNDKASYPDIARCLEQRTGLHSEHDALRVGLDRFSTNAETKADYARWKMTFQLFAAYTKQYPEAVFDADVRARFDEVIHLAVACFPREVKVHLLPPEGGKVQ